MFKQTTSSLCWFSRAIPGRVLSTRTTLCRSISTARTAKPVIGKGPSALIATAIVGGFVIYQLATEPVIRAEEIAVVSPAAVDLKSKLSAQHVQV